MSKTLSCLLGLTVCAAFAQTPPTKTIADFMGYKVRLTTPRLGNSGIAEGDAKVCFERTGESQCFSFPNHEGASHAPIGLNPELELIQLGKLGSAVLFSATQYAGGSGGTVHISLLRPGDEKSIDDYLLSDINLSMQSEHAFWSEPTISPTPIFITADYIWGPGEAHIGDHRYIVSAYTLRPEPILGSDPMRYALDDRFMTIRTYQGRGEFEILVSEKAEILARLKRVKAERERQASQPR